MLVVLNPVGLALLVVFVGLVQVGEVGSCPLAGEAWCAGLCRLDRHCPQVTLWVSVTVLDDECAKAGAVAVEKLHDVSGFVSERVA